MSRYVKGQNGKTKWVYFLTEDDDLLEKYNTIWDKVSADLKKEIDSKPGKNEKFMKTKIKYYGDEVTKFFNKEIPKVISNTCLAVTSLDSALTEDENYDPRVFLKGCKYIKKEKNVTGNIIVVVDFEISSDNSDE